MAGVVREKVVLLKCGEALGPSAATIPLHCSLRPYSEGTNFNAFHALPQDSEASAPTQVRNLVSGHVLQMMVGFLSNREVLALQKSPFH